MGGIHSVLVQWTVGPKGTYHTQSCPSCYISKPSPWVRYIHCFLNNDSNTNKNHVIETRDGLAGKAGFCLNILSYCKTYQYFTSPASCSATLMMQSPPSNFEKLCQFMLTRYSKWITMNSVTEKVVTKVHTRCFGGRFENAPIHMLHTWQGVGVDVEKTK